MCQSVLSRQCLIYALLLVLLGWVIASAVPEAVYAQAPRSVTTTVETTVEGAVASTTVGTVGATSHPSRVLVHFRSGARDFLPGSGAARAFPGNRDLFLVPNPPGLSVAAVVARYNAHPNVLYAEPDYVVRTSADVIPNDTRWADQLDMMKIAAPSAWATQTNASDVVVAIIDTGIYSTHPDLQDNLWKSPPLLPGFTCINGPCVDGGEDDHGHGTHVAGTIGASTNNSLGIAGINWDVQMIPFKFLNSGGSGYISDAIYAFQKIVELKGAPTNLNIRLTSNSWG